jgi:hypothetical protein
LSFIIDRGYNRVMPGVFARAGWLALAVVLFAASGSQGQIIRHKRDQRPAEPVIPAPSVDARDKTVAAPGAFTGRPYWLALAQCGGIYFKLNNLYTEAAVHARVVTPDPTANAEFTRKLKEAMGTATIYLDAAERFLMADRGLERADAVLTYDGQMRVASERVKTVDAALVAAKPCPALYQACREAFPKQCSEHLGGRRP